MYSGFEGYEVIYQKGDNSILHRRVKTRPVHAIGDKTSYGWVVKQILYIYCGKTYTYDEYIRKIKKIDKINNFKTNFININVSQILKIIIELLIVYYFCVNILKF